MSSPSRGPAVPQLPDDAVHLAVRAAAEVHDRFGHRLLRLPGTWIGALSVAAPLGTRPWSPWHYWWQAQYLDTVLDAALLAHGSGDDWAAERRLRRGEALLRGIALRNFGRFPNYFYDDMAWLALAAARLNDCSMLVRRRPSRGAVLALPILGRQLRGAHDLALGGGIWWSKKRDYKNTPANGPAALHFARSGDPARAQAVADWLRSELFDPELGLYLDGIHPSASGRDVERTLYTYNQGPILATLLQLEHPRYVAQAAALIAAIERQLVTERGGVRLEPGGDGSLFTGILCRYLAVAAHDGRLDEAARGTAERLVLATARELPAELPTELSAAVQRAAILAAAASLLR